MENNPLFISNRAIWVLFFCYSTICALLFQKLLLPLAPELHMGLGLLGTDSLIHHQLATQLAASIKESGWKAWEIYSHPAGTGNVAVLAIAYVLFGNDPTLVIPINAMLHASSGFLIYLTGRKLSHNLKYGGIASFIAATVFIALPSSLNWYGQIHKDGYAILGYMIILYACISTLNSTISVKKLLTLFVSCFAGALLIIFVRPYAILITLLAIFASWVLISFICKEKRKNIFLGCLFSLTPIAFSSYLADASKITLEQTSSYEREDMAVHAHWEWQHKDLLPQSLDRLAKGLASFRKTSIQHAYHANSMIDRDIVHENIAEIAAYIPRALQIALFAPFPNGWLDSISLSRLVGDLEIALWYLLLPGVLALLLRKRTPEFCFVLTFSFLFLTFYGYAISNLGTLHRLRYPFLALLSLLGAVGWGYAFELLRTKLRPATNHPNISEHKPPGEKPLATNNSNQSSRKAVLGTGLLISIITALGFVLLFLRDVLMSRHFGIGIEMDAFYIALLIPMFIVNVICIPWGAAFIPTYHQIKSRREPTSLPAFVSSSAVLIFFTLAFLAILIFIFDNSILSAVGIGFTNDQLLATKNLLPIGLVILLFSGLVIIGNSTLNAEHKFYLPAIAQLIVPVAAILALLLFGKKYGAIAVIAGMAIGQLMNLFALLTTTNIRQRIQSVTLTRLELPKDIFSNFILLSLTALVLNLMTVVGNVFASTLGAGGVASFSLGMKVVQFITGVFGMAITTVILPYFSALLSAGHKTKAKTDLAYYLSVVSFVCIPVVIAFYLVIDNLIAFIFIDSAVNASSRELIASISKMGLLQLPFFVAFILISKHANAAKKNGPVALAALTGALTQIALSKILTNFMGGAGIALAISIAMFTSAAILLFISCRSDHIKLESIILILLIWAVYLTFILCLQFKSYPGLAVSLIALFIGALELRHSISTKQTNSDPGY